MDKINGWGEGGETVKLATSDRQAKWREQMRKTPSSRKHLFPLNAAIFRVLKIRKKRFKQWNTELTSHSLFWTCKQIFWWFILARHWFLLVLSSGSWREKKSKQLKMELAPRSLFERANKYVDVFLLDTNFFLVLSRVICSLTLTERGKVWKDLTLRYRLWVRRYEPFSFYLTFTLL